MATKLGTYTIPYETAEKKVAGSDASKGASSYGSASGLDANFSSVISEFIKDAKDAGISISTGKYGWISRDEAEKAAGTGNKLYLNEIASFGWGIAIEIQSMSGKTEDGKTPTEWIASKKSEYGLAYTEAYMPGSSNSIMGRFLKPKSIKQDSDATLLKYDSTTTGGTTGSTMSGGSVASAAYFFSNAFQSYQDVYESETLKGNRALANDAPVWDSVKKACNASLRSCMTLGDGTFIAFYPDYYGLYSGCNKTPYLTIKSIDLIDLKITQSDDEYYSHVFVAGVDEAGRAIDYIYTMGVVSIESDVVAKAAATISTEADEAPQESTQVSAILSKLINIPSGEEWKYTPAELYRRYGARPTKGSSLGIVAQLVENASDQSDSDEKPQYIMPFLAALYEFMNHWANQNKATLQITFQPSLFPGCRIKLEEFDISFFVKSVSHSMSYESGFSTTVECTCPVGTLVSGMVNPS